MTRTAQQQAHPGSLAAASRTRAAGGAVEGGDFAVVVRLPDGRVGLGVGDVAGHGSEAAAAMRRLRSAMAESARSGAAPAQVLAGLGRLIGGADPEAMATAAYTIVDPATGTAVWSRAGHLPFVCSTQHGAWAMDAP